MEQRPQGGKLARVLVPPLRLALRSAATARHRASPVVAGWLAAGALLRAGHLPLGGWMTPSSARTARSA